MRELSNWIYQNLGLSPAFQVKLGTTAIVIFVVLLARILFFRIVSRRTENTLLIYQWRRAINYLVWLGGCLALGRVSY
jgi:hypothetical protein